MPTTTTAYWLTAFTPCLTCDGHGSLAYEDESDPAGSNPGECWRCNGEKVIERDLRFDNVLDYARACEERRIEPELTSEDRVTLAQERRHESACRMALRICDTIPAAEVA